MTKFKPGTIINCFIFSEHESGKLILFGDGFYDEWCVYVGTPRVFDTPNIHDPYPFIHTQLEIIQPKHNLRGFSAKFVDGYLDGVYDFEVPHDSWYFNILRELTYKYDKDVLWEYFITLYNSIPQMRDIHPERDMVGIINRICLHYSEKNIRTVFDILTLAMIAENNKLLPYPSKLGKKLKALGVYQSIFSDMSMHEITHFSKGKTWRDIDSYMKKIGIKTPNL